MGCSLLLMACASPPDTQSQAGVEGGLGSEVKRGAAAEPLERKPVASVDLTAREKDPVNALADPESILSKRSIYFDYDKFDIKTEYRPIVEAHAKYLRDNDDARMLIQGHADERGSREYNLGLGQRRADSVKTMLILLGGKERQIESVSLGEEKPVCQEHNETCWAQNRRAHIRYAADF